MHSLKIISKTEKESEYKYIIEYRKSDKNDILKDFIFF